MSSPDPQSVGPRADAAIEAGSPDSGGVEAGGSEPSGSAAAPLAWPPLTAGAVVEGRWAIAERLDLETGTLFFARDRSLGDRSVALLPAPNATRAAVVALWSDVPPWVAPLVDVVTLRGGCLAVVVADDESVPLEASSVLSRDQMGALLLDAVDAVAQLHARGLSAPDAPSVLGLRVAALGRMRVRVRAERPMLRLLPALVETSDATLLHDELEALALAVARSLFGVHGDPAAVQAQLAVVPDALRSVLASWLARDAATVHVASVATALGVEALSHRVPVPVVAEEDPSAAADGWALRARAATMRAAREAVLLAVFVALIAAAILSAMSLDSRAFTSNDALHATEAYAFADERGGATRGDTRLGAPGRPDPLEAVRAIAPMERIDLHSLPTALTRDTGGARPLSRVEPMPVPDALRPLAAFWTEGGVGSSGGLGEAGVVYGTTDGDANLAAFHVVDALGQSSARAVLELVGPHRWEGDFRTDAGRVVARVAFDASRFRFTLRTAWGESLLGGCAAWHAAPDANGFPATIQCVDATQSVARHADGWLALRVQRDVTGNVVRIDSLHDDTLALVHDGWTTVIIERDPAGREVRRQYQTATGAPAESLAYGAATIVRRRSEDGVAQSVQLLDAHGHATVGTEGWHEARWDYDVGEDEILWSLYDTTGRLLSTSAGPFPPITVYRLDEGGRVVERAAAVSRTRSTRFPRGNHQRTLTLYDAWGRVAIACDFDAAGPVASDRLLGAFCVRSVWHERSNELSERVLLDVYEAAPLRTATGRDAGARYTFDATGRLRVQRVWPSGIPSGGAADGAPDGPDAAMGRAAVALLRGDPTQDPFWYEGVERDDTLARRPVWDPRVAMEGPPEARIVPRF